MRWSNSMLYTLQQCGERFRRRYIERDFRPTGIGAKRGLAIHAVAAASHMRQLKAKEAASGRLPAEARNAVLPTIEEAKDMAATVFEAEVAKGVSFSKAERDMGVDRVKAGEKDDTVLLSAHYVKRVAPEINPLGVERRIVIHPGGDLEGEEVQGIVDLVAEEELPTAEPPSMFDQPPVRRVRLAPEESGPTIEIVHDLKSSKRMPRSEAINSNQQLTLYALLRTVERGGTPPDKVRLTTVVATGRGPQHVVQTGTRGKKELNAVASRVRSAIEAAKRGAFVPANPDSWWCSAKFCEYFSDCKFAIAKGDEDEVAVSED